MPSMAASPPAWSPAWVSGNDRVARIDARRGALDHESGPKAPGPHAACAGRRDSGVRPAGHAGARRFEHPANPLRGRARSGDAAQARRSVQRGLHRAVQQLAELRAAGRAAGYRRVRSRPPAAGGRLGRLPGPSPRRGPRHRRGLPRRHARRRRACAHGHDLPRTELPGRVELHARRPRARARYLLDDDAHAARARGRRTPRDPVRHHPTGLPDAAGVHRRDELQTGPPGRPRDLHPLGSVGSDQAGPGSVGRLRKLDAEQRK